jgi:hypothetical protein
MDGPSEHLLEGFLEDRFEAGGGSDEAGEADQRDFEASGGGLQVAVVEIDRGGGFVMGDGERGWTFVPVVGRKRKKFVVVIMDGGGIHQG